MGLSPYGCERMVAELQLLLGHQTLWMLPRSISGVLIDSSGLCGPPWVKKWGHYGVTYSAFDVAPPHNGPCARRPLRMLPWST